MTKTQKSKCRLERVGVRIACKLLGIKRRQPYTSPFDCHSETLAVEVKTMSANGRDLKIHIAPDSLERKLKCASETGLKPTLIAIVVDNGTTRIYQSELRRSVRINQMVRIN
jgi:hypothetical protein